MHGASTSRGARTGEALPERMEKLMPEPELQPAALDGMRRQGTPHE
ncbi:hypothetical protein HED55_05735 [Ochrobactrum haematophilum]|uniref:Uncharacterized protein n=1 Tax=Brucella haematophila TaxID=419474 RepID=A0ABX1DKT9_9HYPH|nr:hypothetical protein [Brucella haematophila]